MWMPWDPYEKPQFLLWKTQLFKTLMLVLKLSTCTTLITDNLSYINSKVPIFVSISAFDFSSLFLGLTFINLDFLRPFCDKVIWHLLAISPIVLPFLKNKTCQPCFGVVVGWCLFRLFRLNLFRLLIVKWIVNSQLVKNAFLKMT